MKTVAIAGVGLIGGSLGFALKKHSLAGTVLGVSSPGTIAKALRLGAIDEGVALEEALRRAEVLVLAQPISGILKTLEGLPSTKALVTDVGSTKARIVEAAGGVADFVGGHPMAGKESRGVEEADPDLFVGRPWILTPVGALTEAGGRWKSVLEAIGARVILLDPAEHDRLVALSSHLPQLLSTALASSLEGTGAHRTGGPGLVDMTRLALSDYDIWRDIFATNGAEIRAALDRAIATLAQMRGELEDDRLGEQFARAKALAQRLREK